MALFQRNPVREEYAVPYTVSYGQTEYILIVGLGNPGKKYQENRHNIGFKVVDQLAEQLGFGEFSENKDLKSLVSQAAVGSYKVILLKPQTYMNESGQAVRAVKDYYKIPINKIALIHDELSINFGQIRTRIGGQSAGHNGIKSVISHIGQDFGRIRIGIKNSTTPKDDTSGFVLKNFNKEEKAVLDELIKEAALIGSEYIYGGQLPHDTRNIMV